MSNDTRFRSLLAGMPKPAPAPDPARARELAVEALADPAVRAGLASLRRAMGPARPATGPRHAG